MSGKQPTNANETRANSEISRPDHSHLLRSALETIERMQARLDAAEKGRSAPIAVIGMSCRFPGGANSPEQLWELLREKRDAIAEIPRERWDPDAYARIDPDAAARMHPQFGGLIDDIDKFDPGFFGIAPREITTMDPQHRLVLEVSWEALERAGYAPDRLAGSLTGVFVAITGSDYAQVVREADPSQVDVYFATGNAHNAGAGRVSYLLGLRGPSMAVDTACSSSLTAVHLACQSLRLGECNMAVASGVNALLVPDPFVFFAKWGMMAPDGRCKTFDAAANGFVRAEGCGVLVLKRLSDALAARDPILAVIRGSAVNQDGASGGLTVPNGLAQQAVIRQALAAANVSPSDIDYVEAHGTGTSLGDPIELEAIDAVLGEGRPHEKPLVVGSIKTNVGHLESAAGVAGLIKVILSLQHREIPANLHFHELNPRITLRRLQVTVPTSAVPWPNAGRPGRAGVSSFGFSGTNAHVILEEAPPVEHPAKPGTDLQVSVMTLSAKSENALDALAQEYEAHFRARPGDSWADACFTSNLGRSRFPHRLAVVASTAEEAVEKLAAARASSVAGVHRGVSAGNGGARKAFLFTGQGAQYAGMGRKLFETAPAFRGALERCDQILKDELDQDLLAVVYPDNGAASPIDQTMYTQPALFAFEYAMAELWKSWGVQPDIVLGHSVGEYVAACIAGVFSLEDALKLVAARGRLMQALPTGGAMAAVFAPEHVVSQALTPFRDRASIAALNAPENVVISGEEAAIAEVLSRVGAQGIGAKRLSVSHAFHSPLIEPMLDAFERVAQQVRYSAPKLPVVSNLTGQIAEAGEITTPSYWRRHVRSAVRFADCVRAAGASANVFLEVGPSPTLIGMARACLPAQGDVFVASCRYSQDDRWQITDALAAAHVAGVAVDWEAVHRGSNKRRVVLPTYPFERARYWIGSGNIGRQRRPGGNQKQALHPFLEVHIAVADEPQTHIFEGEISLERFPFLEDHCIQGRAIFPASAFSELALAAKRVAFGGGPVALENVKYDSPLSLQPGGDFRIQVRVSRSEHGDFRFAISSQPLTAADGARRTEWTSHVSGDLRNIAVPPEGAITPDELDAIRARCPRQVEGGEFYRKLAERGNQWGPSFQGVTRLWLGDRELVGEVTAPDALKGEIADYEWHPAVADACAHAQVGANSLERTSGPRGGAVVGGSMAEARLYATLRGPRFWIHARVRDDDDESSNVLRGDMRVFDDALNLVAELCDVQLWYLDESSSATEDRDWTYSVQFVPLPDPPERQAIRPCHRWIVLSDRQGVGDALAEALQAAGDQTTRLYRRQPCELGADRDSAALLEVEQLAAALSTLRGESDAPIGVVHLWALDHQLSDAAGTDELEQALAGGIETLLLCMKALVAGSGSSVRLWAVTRGAQSASANDPAVDPAHAAIWGLARSFALEYPFSWGGIIDLDLRATPDGSASLLAEEIGRPGGEDQLAFRDGRRLGARLVRERLARTAQRSEWRADATYVVTGGLGGLGLVVAQWLVEHGVRHVALVGRTPLPPRSRWEALPANTRDWERVNAVRRLEATGAQVYVGCADVGDQASVNACFEQLAKSGWPEVRGVIHAAGIMSYRSIPEITEIELREVLRAKAIGGWLLHNRTAGLPLDEFVLFSSASAILNLPFMAAYAAANAFLDGLAHRREKQGLKALAINWGVWAGVGMAATITPQAMAMIEKRGMTAIPVDAGLRMFGLLLQANKAQLAVLPCDWATCKRLFPGFADTPFLRGVVGSPGEAFSSAQDTRMAIASASGEERQRLVRQVALTHIAGVLGLSEAKLENNTSLSRLGLDSLMATELRNRLETATGCSLPLVRLLEGPSPTELVELVEQSLPQPASLSAEIPQQAKRAAAAVAGADQASVAAAMLDGLDNLSDEEVDKLLKQMLNEQGMSS